MELVTGWLSILGFGGLLFLTAFSFGVFLVARTFHPVRWVIPSLWAAILLLLPVLPYLYGRTGNEGLGEFFNMWSVPALFGLLPLLGWRRRCPAN